MRRTAMAAMAAVMALVVACGPPARGRGEAVKQGVVIEGVLPLLDGGEVDVGAQRGKIVVLHVFTTSSLAALNDVEELNAVQAAGEGKVVVIGIALDREGFKLVDPWRRGAGATYLVALATPQIMGGESALGDVMAAVPATVVLGRDGRVKWSKQGALGKGELARRIEGL